LIISSSKTAHIEDEMINLPGSSSKNALFEDEMRGRRRMAGGGGTVPARG
jgi:hypothetical protein